MIKERQVHILFHFGEIEPGYPEGRFLVDVTVDLVNEKAVGLVVTHPLKPLPVYYLIQIQNKTEQSLSIFINDTYIGDVLPGAEITNYKAWFTTIFNIKAESLQGQILFKQEITLEEMKKIDWKVVIPPLQNK